jgi:transposase-like protein
MPKLLKCPKCGYSRSWVLRRDHRRCKSCRAEWSPRMQFLVRGMRLSRDDWKTIIDAFLDHETIRGVVKHCRFSYVTVHSAIVMIRSVMISDVPTRFDGTCEADETYIGGAWKNKAIHIRRQGSKRGRGTNKQCIFGIVCRSAKQARIWLVPNAKRRTLIPIIRSQVKTGGSIYTDGCKSYRILPKLRYHHEWVDHDAGEFVRGDVHTQTIDGLWGLLKTHLDSIGGIKKKNALYFVGEYLWRYNFRHLTHEEKIVRIVDLLVRIGGR